jgi:hypothetical protein
MSIQRHALTECGDESGVIQIVRIIVELGSDGPREIGRSVRGVAHLHESDMLSVKKRDELNG